MMFSKSRRVTRVGTRMRGFTLLEVLVAVLVLSIGMLGVAGLQIWGLRYNQSAYQSSQATAVISDLVDRMRANPEATASGQYVFTTSTPLPEAQPCIAELAGCSAASLAKHDIREWRQNSLQRLGEASARVERSGDVFSVTVNWKDRADAGADGSPVDRAMTMQVRL